jgi:hypothetical protein
MREGPGGGRLGSRQRDFAFVCVRETERLGKRTRWKEIDREIMEEERERHASSPTVGSTRR